MIEFGIPVHKHRGDVIAVDVRVARLHARRLHAGFIAAVPEEVVTSSHLTAGKRFAADLAHLCIGARLGVDAAVTSHFDFHLAALEGDGLLDEADLAFGEPTIGPCPDRVLIQIHWFVELLRQPESEAGMGRVVLRGRGVAERWACPSRRSPVRWCRHRRCGRSRPTAHTSHRVVAATIPVLVALRVALARVPTHIPAASVIPASSPLRLLRQRGIQVVAVPVSGGGHVLLHKDLLPAELDGVQCALLSLFAWIGRAALVVRSQCGGHIVLNRQGDDRLHAVCREKEASENP
mmetsp:Transcript_16635/g.35167  ORF Transcript_16635/g.35167 Transcript_16635/m.35167 type:complete len:292 (-) Transcript_16635:106-981(-)